MDYTLRHSAFNKKNGRYLRGGQTEVSGKALEWWDKKYIAKDPSDIMYIMEDKYAGRPDLLGYAFYGDPGLWWIICQYNGILDPMTELVEGTVLLLPTQAKVTAQFTVNSGTGGVPTTRNTTL